MKTYVLRVGIDAGSTTVKMVVLDAAGEILYKSYRRHKADVGQMLREELTSAGEKFPNATFSIAVTGSAGMGIAEQKGIPFVQEVVAAVNLTRKMYPQVRTLLDIGGEDAKMVFFSENRHPDIRMNGNCAGGTGAFIDQMASLLNMQVEQFSEEAARYEKIYPVASRCGVFAKTDIQSLIGRHAAIPDIAASTLYAVALQTLTSLARGYDIAAPVLCTGGPLTFIPLLREQFRQILKLQPDDLLLPDNSEYFPALGAALYAGDKMHLFDIERISHTRINRPKDLKNTLPALFENEEEYNDWKMSRNIRKIRFAPVGTQKQVQGFLGIDSGSTTTKIAVIDDKQRIVFQYYANNEGDSLKKVSDGLSDFRRQAKEQGVEVNILSSAVTGYGEDLIRSALGIEYGIVETMAHLAGAQYIDPQVSFILDIGGQDMKSIYVNNGVIANIELNEACSSGCGSFLQNFASTMHLNLNDFSRKACLSKHPSNLGSRCTVFMNSKVKQSLREGAGIDDIAAGLAYSVVKNCLFKVLKVSNLNVLGEHIVVQGGTFRNDAVYRALELLSEKSVATTDYPELMGAFGAALYAFRQWNGTSQMTKMKQVKTDFFTNRIDINSIKNSVIQCKGCSNQCEVVKLKFHNGNICYTGNKCEKVFSASAQPEKKGFNAFDIKGEILFSSQQSTLSAPLEKIGIPRVLNLFDDFPFWNALFTACGYTVVLSPESTVNLYKKGVSGIMSDNICFPAKLAHGHIVALLEQKPDRIFYPLIPKVEKEFQQSSNSYNCPVVSGYPDVIRSAIDPEERYGIPFDTPVICFNHTKTLKKNCWAYFSGLGVDRKIFDQAFRKALTVRDATKIRLIDIQKNILRKSIHDKSLVLIVAGRPYHSDPLIHQKTGQILADLGVDVLTDDVFGCLSPDLSDVEKGEEGFKKLNVVSQWSYPNRVIQTALQVAKLPANVQLIQLNSFGCGPDSFLMDEISEILKKAGKNLTVIRIDEIASPGSVRLRLRSLVESLKAASPHSRRGVVGEVYKGYSATFEKKDRQKTILVPWFADFISPFVPAIGKISGYNLVNLPPSDRLSAEIGLKYGHNEVCYPSTLVLGDIIKGLQSGKYDLKNTAAAITQTGGQCRATNYIAQIKTGLERAGFGEIPVISVTAGKKFQNSQSGFRLPWHKLVNIAIFGALYGDALNQMYSATAVREKVKGESRKLFDFYMECGSKIAALNDPGKLIRLLKQAVADFNLINVYDRKFTKIGFIGEIYVKYNNYGQAHISEWLRERNMEVITPPIIDFIVQYFVNVQVNITHGIKDVSLAEKMLQPLLHSYLNRRIETTEAILKAFRFYVPNESIFSKARYAEDILHLSNQFGEGWMIAAEVATYARRGINKVVCIQPFGCIANHIVAKGIEKRLKKFYPEMDLLYLDIDSGIADVNLQNRLHFMM